MTGAKNSRSALATGLQRGKRYYYVFGSDLTGWSTESYFTAPNDPMSVQQTTIGIVGGEKFLGIFFIFFLELSDLKAPQKIISIVIFGS
jgi:beta-N-acetylglucosaminidase